MRFQPAFLQYFSLFSLIAYISIADGEKEIRCGAIDIRNKPDEIFKSKDSNSLWNLYKECTVLEGDFSMLMITDKSYKNEHFPVFEKIKEITGCILIYQVRGLTSLGKIFPNLRIIGGHSLIMNYALVIYQNPDLLNIGLDKLTIIRNGGVRITENPKLCYAKFINWNSILIGKIWDVIVETGTRQAFFSESQQLPQKCLEREGCAVKDPSKCHSVDGITSCWNNSTCQPLCRYQEINGTLGPGCSPSGEKCHNECIGGCEKANDASSCYGCRHVENEGVCLKRCPPNRFELLENRCVEAAECNNKLPKTSLMKDGEEHVWKPFKGKCHYECPPGYQEKEQDRKVCIDCKGDCPKKCHGAMIDSIGEAMKLSKCNIIDGNLEIEIKIGVEAIAAEKFTEAFGAIEEITGYLLIRFSPAFTSLHMFKNLKKIQGQNLYHGRFALVVYENQNLRQLFHLEKREIEISNGIVSFQNNRMLCYRKINTFLEHVGLEKNITDNDVSSFSNGDKAVCDEILLDVDVYNVMNFGFILRWNKFNTTDMDQRKFLGYQIFYKKVEKEDPEMSIDDDRSACADSWMMQVVDADSESVGGEMVPAEPNTLYAFYVQTRLVNHPGARNAISKIKFVRTHFGHPDPPRLRTARSVESDQIYLEWDPPLKPNGVITHYTVIWTESPDFVSSATQNPCVEKPRHSTSLISTIPTTNPDSEVNTCPADKGCCKCDEPEKENSVSDLASSEANEINTRIENAQFENAVQDIVFVQSPGMDGKSSKKRSIRSLLEASENKKQPNKIPTIDLSHVLTVESSNSSQGKVNITTNRVIIGKLHHFTEYTIDVIACQDINAKENHCSEQTATRTIRTNPIPENDVINLNSVIVEEIYPVNGSEIRADGRKVSWKIPEHPNGLLLAFRVKVWQDGGNTPIEQCVSLNDYKKNNGVVFSGLNNGKYSLNVSSITLAGTSRVNVNKELFEIYVPGWLTWDKGLYITSGILLVLIALCLIIYRYIRRHFGKKVQEYLRQTISANPEYLSQLDVYKADEWELKREDLTLHEEIGRGTFGKVLRGTGNNITSVCGIKFGKCAIKTVPECATNAERLHFLIEASVMKQFNTAFIVKLYGVVSEGHPVLVVMEMMDLGNLRDYLRARRPDAEENVDNSPLPSMISYFKWATQIADGMAYLESLKFCHRDLAARNCMVSSDETVKIGDFGMARDIYYHEYYKPAGKRLMPVRWMAPESLKDGKFTVKSDVWSYGIVLYEMLTLGQQPYAGLGNDQVFNYIGVKRNILVRPVGCPDFWYDLMRVCWKYDPRDRPCFYQIVLHIKSTIDNCFKDFPTVREQGMSVFERCFVVQSFDDIDDEDYDFTYNEDEEEARKHKMLKELELLTNQEEDSEYYKQGFGAPGKMDGLCDIGEDGEGGRFNMLTLQDLTHSEKPEKLEVISKKMIKARDKEREKFHKKQKEISEKRKRDSKPIEEIELAEQSSPMFVNGELKPEITVLDEKETLNPSRTIMDEKIALPSEKQQLIQEEEN